MSIVSNRKFIYYLADAQDRTYYVDAGVVKKSAIPTRIKTTPDGWKDMTFQWATNAEYFSTIRSFTTALRFVKDGQAILADRMFNGAGTEEYLYLIILRSDPSMGLNGYKLEYKSRLDLSKFDGDIRTGIGTNLLQDDVFSLVQANESAVYSLPCNSSNPKAVRVLFDGILLQDKFNYQPIDTVFNSTDERWHTVPLAFLNNEGDNIGIINNSTNDDSFSSPHTYITDPANENYIMKSVDPITIHIKGTIVIDVEFIGSPTLVGLFAIEFATDLAPFPPPANYILISTTTGLAPGRRTIPVDMKIDLAAGEKLFMLIAVEDVVGGNPYTVHLETSNLSILFASKQVPSLAWGIRPLDALQQMVSQMTNGKFTADSNFFRANNNKLIISGSSLRNFPDAVAQFTFKDFFKSYSCEYNLGIVVRNGVLFIEPVTDIYNSSKELKRIQNASKVKITVAQDRMYNSVKVGYLKQTYNQRNGRYEFNCTHNYKLAIDSVINQLDLVSPFRADPFGAEFIRTNYPDLNSTDDKGDADIWMIDISDSVGHAEGEISTAVAFTVETLILAAPVIKSPFTNSIIYFANPTITGVSQANMLITIYVDGEIDGTTNADSNGNWSYEIQGALQSLSDTFNGVHTIAANAQTDPLNISSFSKVLTITVNTQVQSPFLITSPSNNDTLYNNLPVIQGIAPPGSVVTIKDNLAPITTVIANTSGIWYYQVVTALTEGIHLISVSSPGLTAPASVFIAVNVFVDEPLITSIQYNDIIYNNLPLIKGVAIPGTVVSVYLDGGGGAIVGGIPGPMGTAVADANGDWSFQVVNVTDSSGNVTAYIPEGLHIVSTTPTPVNVEASIAGYLLARGSNGGPVMDYDAIKLDDQFIPPGVDPSTLPPTLGMFLHPETLYNILSSPLRMLRAHDSILKSSLIQRLDQLVMFNGAEMNPNLVTKKNGVVFNEGANVNPKEMAPNLYLPYYLNWDAPIDETFNDTLQSIDNDGYMTVMVKDTEIYVLPIGGMTMKPATGEAQTWKTLISGKTSFSSLLDCFGNGLKIQIGKNMVRFSDLNPLHFVRYNYTPPAGYHFADIYDNWQKNRFERWPVYQPDYYQPVQQGKDKIPLQIIPNGVGEVQIQVFSITTGTLIDTIIFEPVAGSPVQPPNVLQELLIDPDDYPEGQYWCAAFTGGAIFAVSEKIWIKADWPDTFLFEYDKSTDEIDYYFSTGIKPMIRVQAQFLIWEPDSEVDAYEDEAGDWEITRGVPIQKRVLQLGNEKSLISDWMAKKMNHITLLDNWRAEGIHHTRNKNSKFDREDLGKGIPELIVKMDVVLADNEGGFDFATSTDETLPPPTFALDARAFGRNSGVINVTENPE